MFCCGGGFMRKRYVLKNKKRFILFISFITFIMLTTLFAASVQGYKEPTYMEITVFQGDNLWNIAEKYSTGGDLREYIHKIIEINNLSGSNIYAGSKLLIPVGS